MRLFAITLLVLPLLGCNHPSTTATDIGHPQLKADALAMVEQWEAADPEDRSIPESFWPESIQLLEPVDVYPHMLGVLVVKSKSDRYHSGIYIVTADDSEEETNPSSGSGVSYRTLSTGLHEAEIKIRRAAQPDG